MPDAWKVYSTGLTAWLPHAFYEPPNKTTIRPGDVGYIDTTGNWNWLQRVRDDEPLVVDDPIRWGPRHPSGVRQSDVQANLQ
jgi:hypothetical protein